MRPAVDRAVGPRALGRAGRGRRARVRRDPRVGRRRGGRLHDDAAHRPGVQPAPERGGPQARSPSACARCRRRDFSEMLRTAMQRGRVAALPSRRGARLRRRPAPPGDLRMSETDSDDDAACAGPARGIARIAGTAWLRTPAGGAASRRATARACVRCGGVGRAADRAVPAAPRPSCAGTRAAARDRRRPRRGGGADARGAEPRPTTTSVDPARSRAPSCCAGRPTSLRGGRPPRLRAHPRRAGARRGPHPAPAGARGPAAGGRRAQRPRALNVASAAGRARACR